ncbi:hypothetical protein F5883DRAFT_702832 [Diaporthe sp. PMI_573]|nr:hypothetical protein F5883DRAFT_702832 [Diaporthaceae sp. PMI_573]
MGAFISCLSSMKKPWGTNVVAETDGKNQAMIIAGFCAIGKTHFLSNKPKLLPRCGMKVYDLDSSAYSSKPGFPQNYIFEIRKLAQEPCIVLISTHEGLPTQLAKDGYYVALVYPGDGPGAKREWLRRLEEREEGGKNSRLYKLTDKNWDLWCSRTAGEQTTSKWSLSNEEYLGTIVRDIYADFLGPGSASSPPWTARTSRPTSARLLS